MSSEYILQAVILAVLRNLTISVYIIHDSFSDSKHLPGSHYSGGLLLWFSGRQFLECSYFKVATTVKSTMEKRI